MRLRLLGTSGLRVSELCLGTMTFGNDWGWGAEPEVCRAIFERFVAAGGNFIDTATNYTDGSSERIVGELIAHARERYVVATKYTLRIPGHDSLDANHGGNSRKAMLRTVERSLRAMRTDYIDVLYLHMWDETTPIDEVLRAADDLVRQGKILYFAFSDTPAWVVSAAIARAEAMGWTRPIAVQGPYSLLDRDLERDVLPMARTHSLSVLAWGTLEGGVLSGKYSRSSDEPRRQSSVDARELAAGAELTAIADAIGCTPAQAAIAWVRAQPGVIPILGCRTVAQLIDNLGSLQVQFTPEQRARLDAVAHFRIGFPFSFLHSANVRNLIFGPTFERLYPEAGTP